MWLEFQQLSSVLWIMVTSRGQSYPVKRTVSSHFDACRPLLAHPDLPYPEPVNGDDRMAADPGQLRRPPNSARAALRQATRIEVTLINRNIGSNSVGGMCPSVTTRAHPALPGARAAPSLTVMPGIGSAIAPEFRDAATFRNAKSVPRAGARGTRAAASATYGVSKKCLRAWS